MIVSDAAALRRILTECRVIAVVGMSAKADRPSFVVAKYLLDHGYIIIPVNPGESEILGQKCYPSLKDVPRKPDIVDCFRKSEDIPPIAEDAVAVGARVLWLQLGVINEAATQRASEAGL